MGEKAEENQKGKCGGEGKRRKREESLFSLSLLVLLLRNLRSLPPHFSFLYTAPSQRKNKENFQNRSYDIIIHERDKRRIWIYHLRRKRLDFTFREQPCGKELGQKTIAFTHPQRPLFSIGRSDHFQQISCNFHPLGKNFIPI